MIEVYPMQTAPLAEVKAKLSAYVEECENDGPVVITRNGKAVAVLLAPTDDEDLENILLTRSPRFQALLARSRQSVQEGKSLSEDDFWQAVAQQTEQPQS